MKLLKQSSKYYLALNIRQYTNLVQLMHTLLSTFITYISYLNNIFAYIWISQLLLSFLIITNGGRAVKLNPYEYMISIDIN